ncbi:MAG TPA: glycosyltransferase 87 family protein [Mycobacteriales bacterium]|nr:glycosyltransferase 87 family protein [Mycobacteriales bacterium]
MPTPPTREDPFVAGASEAIGGPFGRHASNRRWSWWTPLRVALGVTVLVCVFGYLQKSPCLTHSYSDEYQYTRLCYTDTYVLYTVEGLNAHTDAAGKVVGSVGVPYRDHPVEYPPVIGGLMWAAAEVTSVLHGGGADASGVHATTFFDVTALGLAALALVSTWSVAQLVGKKRAWDAVMVAASPVLFMHAFTNWDLAAVALTGIGLWLWSRGSPAWAGVALGLGVAAKLYPALVLLALLMLCARERNWRAAATVTGTAALALVAMYVPAILISSGHAFPFPSASCTTGPMVVGWKFFTSLSKQRGVDWGSLWLVVQHLAQGLESHVSSGSVMHSALDSTGKAITGPTGTGSCSKDPTALNRISETSVALVIVGVGALVAWARQRPRVGQVAFLLVAGFVMLNKVDSPQYALWLVPLAVLARPRWTSILVWQVTEVMLGAANLYTLIALDHSDQGLPMDTYLIFVVIRDLVLVGLMALVVREVLHPRLDVVRRDGVDDPAGGVLLERPIGVDGAP